MPIHYKAPCLMIGGQMAKIIESKNSQFPVGSDIFGQFGWRSHTVLNPTIIQKNAFRDCYIYPKFGDLPKSLGLGYLGMPGNTGKRKNNNFSMITFSSIIALQSILDFWRFVSQKQVKLS